jgi:hypothetical protein
MIPLSLSLCQTEANLLHFVFIWHYALVKALKVAYVYSGIGKG